MKYIIEFELPDNDAVSKGIKVESIHWAYHGYSGYCRAKQKIERKKGKWIKPTRVPDSMLEECSVCGFDCGAYTFNYCPCCGAEMVGET